MVKDLHIVCLAGCEWDFTWQPTQEVMQRLAQAGNHILYVEPTGMRRLRLSDWRRVLRRFRTKLTFKESPDPRLPTLRRYAPLILPFPHARLARLINRSIILGAVRRWLARDHTAEPIFWFYFPSPLNADLMRHASSRLSVYHLMSSAEAARAHQGIVAANEAMLEGCDLVFANSRRLWQQARKKNPHSYLFRAGVNLEVFEAGDAGEGSRPEDLGEWAGPTVGYVGALHEWVDVKLLAEVAAAMPECRFVMLGPIVGEVGPLRGLPNVKWLGQKPHRMIPSYVRRFHACIIPYVRDAYTETAYPAKLNEYLALGKPVVATPLPELEDYNREHGGVLRLAGDASAFAAALREVLAGTTPALRERYRQAARRNSWAVQVAEMAQLIEKALSRPRSQESQERETG